VNTDVLVIGGGINGAGIARDAALRGLRVTLLEKSDFGSGTSSWSSRLIHGGLRYLEYGEIPLVFESLHERRRLLELAPHLVAPLRLKIPVYEGARRGKWLIRLGLLAYDLLSIGKRTQNHRMLDRATMLSEEPGLLDQGLVGGAEYSDAQVTFAERLVLENVLAAGDAGASVQNYCEVTSIHHGDEKDSYPFVVGYTDRRNGSSAEVCTKYIVNAAGPWVDAVLTRSDVSVPALMGGTKGSHIIVRPFVGCPDTAFYIEAKSDGRPFFVIPWNDQYLIGTTDIRYAGDPAAATASMREVTYLIDETNRIFPNAGLSIDNVEFSYAGIRPLPKREQGPESAITRKHIIHEHHGDLAGVLSIIGGKLTTYRNLAEQVVDRILKISRADASPCATRTRPLPGAMNLSRATQYLRRGEAISRSCQQRLLGVYGSRAALILDSADPSSSLEFIDSNRTVLGAEVSFAIEHEHAVSLTDIIYRRLMMGYDPDLEQDCVHRIAELAADHAGWTDEQKNDELSRLADYQCRLQPRKS